MPNTRLIGLDVSKEKIAVAVAEEGRSSARYLEAVDARASGRDAGSAAGR